MTGFKALLPKDGERSCLIPKCPENFKRSNISLKVTYKYWDENTLQFTS